jgi:tRNA-specific 2-thiouridylase
MKIAVLVSGGVDSSVALALLKEQGHDITAFYLKIWLEDELSYLGTCPWQEDLEYVTSVCKQLNLPLEIVSLQKEYWDRVVSYTIGEIKAGRTPNPDILCNRHIKFGAFFDKIDASFDKVATGHYAQVLEKNDVFYLTRSADSFKDQTYFLSQMTQAQLSRALFPIGHLKKGEVRAIAHKLNLPTKNRKDSQGICFLGKLKFADFIRHHVGDRPGDLIEIESGTKVGIHQGFWYYTIGQRQGIGLAGGPWYVVAKDPEKNIIFISRNYYSADKKRNTFTIERCNWIAGQPDKSRAHVKVRHGEHMYGATVAPLDGGRWSIVLDEHDQGIAPGQFAALYDNDVCLGNGVIFNDIFRG